MKTPRLLLFGLLSSLISSTVLAAPDFGFAQEDGGQAGAFFDAANSARSLAMAGADVGVADDASAVLTNPAGLTQINRKDFVTSYSSLFEDTKFGVMNYAQPSVGLGTFGVGVVSLRSGGFEKRDANQRQGGEFGTSELGVVLSHGFELSERLSLGSSLKVIKEQVDSLSATGFGFDGGAHMRISPTLNMGFVLRNIWAPRLKLRNENDQYPFDMRLGTRWQAFRKIMIATDLDKTVGRSIKLRLGGEWTVNQLLVVRAGISETDLTTGVGFNFKDWGIDYAFGYNDAAAGIKDLGGSHRVGFRIRFGAPISEQLASARWQKKGQAYLDELRSRMEMPDASMDASLEKLLSDTQVIIRRQGYPRAEDLYSAQGYVFYFQHEYERSVQSLSEALALNPNNGMLSKHLEKARAQMTEEGARELIATELKRVKELYEKGDWQGTIKSCEKILSIKADNIEALAYREDAHKRINEPIEREMKIAKGKFESNEFLDAIKGFQRVKELDPQNQEASDYIAKSITALENQASTQTVIKSERPVYEVERNVEESRNLYSKGLLLYSQGNLKAAARIWEQAVQYDSGNAMARSAFNRVQVELKERP